MDGMLFIVFGPVMTAAAFAILSLRFGVDSRPGSTDPRSPVHELSI